jgi:hypothetical protein
MDKNNEEEASWSLPKILAGIAFLGIVGWFVYQNKSLILSYNNEPTKDVAGVQTQRVENNANVSVPHIDLQEKINEITQQVSNLDIKDVASSSPQVQKVLHDMESLKDLPKSQAKDACMKICSGL